MTPGEFISKWSDTGLRERAGAQSHLIDLCRMLGEKPPVQEVHTLGALPELADAPNAW